VPFPLSESFVVPQRDISLAIASTAEKARVSHGRASSLSDYQGQGLLFLALRSGGTVTGGCSLRAGRRKKQSKKTPLLWDWTKPCLPSKHPNWRAKYAPDGRKR
jgi:hypothetical protein